MSQFVQRCVHMKPQDQSVEYAVPKLSFFDVTDQL